MSDPMSPKKSRGKEKESKKVLNTVEPAYCSTEENLEDQDASKESLARPLVFTSSLLSGIGVFLVIFLILGLSTSCLLYESSTDRTYLRLALLVVEPLIMVLSTFFAIYTIGDLFQIMGPIATLTMNSRFYSAVKPDLRRAYANGFRPSPITIQMPVYKESLDGVIIPTVKSLKAAISFYEAHGGAASIFVNDDGMSNIADEEAQARINYYDDNNIG
jgi:hypothetical protein